MDVLGDFLLELYRLAHACQAKEFQAEAMNLLQTQVTFDSGRRTHGRHKLNGERTLCENHMQNDPPELREGSSLALQRPTLQGANLGSILASCFLLLRPARSRRRR